MPDVTVLVSPTGVYPRPRSALGFSLNFARRSQPDLISPVMVTLESTDSSTDPSPPVELPTFDASLLSPPSRTSRGHSTNSSKRPQSAPPAKVSFAEPVKPPPRRTLSATTSTFAHARELKRPPPPLFRPRTFWRKTRRSGVTGASYSPASHLVRRATFLAANLTLDTPAADLSALGVESRVAVLILGPDHILHLCPTV